MADHDAEEGDGRNGSLGFETRAIRGGGEPTAEVGGAGDVVSPIHLEDRLAALEDADRGMAFASGTAAITCLCLATLEPGDHVLAFDSLYGGTRVLFDDLLSGFGIEIEYVDATDPGIVADAMTPETALL